MRVIIDAHVLIAAYAARGLCHAILELCIANDNIFLTTAILADVQEKLIKRIKLPAETAGEIVSFLKNNAELVSPAEVPLTVCRDPDDLDILGAAKTAVAEFIISGDEDLLVIGDYSGTRIVNPRQYWEAFSKRAR
jgi:putative PIN family toxin of toxin-antitoxin system